MEGISGRRGRGDAQGKLMKPCIGCDETGEPEPGYSFYLCGVCCDRLADGFDKNCSSILKALDASRAGECFSE